MSLEGLFVVCHVAAGAVSLMIGVAAMLAHKGGRNHRRWGKIYFWAMFTIFATSLGLLVYRPNYFLLAISFLAFYNALTGYRALARKQMAREWRHAWLDWTAAGVAALGSVGFATWGLSVLLNLAGPMFGQSVPPGFGILGLAFGLGLGSQASTDLRSFHQPPTDLRWWWFYQMERFLGSYIAAVTAFTVQVIGRRLPGEIGWLVWVAPGLIGGLGIGVWAGHYRRKFVRLAHRGSRTLRQDPVIPAHVPVEASASVNTD